MPHAPVLDDERRDDRLALRAMLQEITEGINRRDWDSLTPWLDRDVQVTMIDCATLRGPEALMDYVESKLERFGSVLIGFTVDPSLAAPAVFHGETAIVALQSADRFHFRNGRDLTVQSTYSAAMVRKESGWKLVALHAGVNAFANPISDQKQLWLTGGMVVAGLAGLLVGSIVGAGRGQGRARERGAAPGGESGSGRAYVRQFGRGREQ
ncbi:MAG: hypothetical protein IPK72_23350 [Candidatus Eisenbacteria bacterium]|nr:hypothetical protein [Candidatus Eisenbacteria bacterium]